MYSLQTIIHTHIRITTHFSKSASMTFSLFSCAARWRGVAPSSFLANMSVVVDTITKLH